MAPLALLFPEVLQRGMPQIFLAAQVLHAADQPWLHPLRRRPLHALRRKDYVFLDALPDIAPCAAFGHQGPCQGHH